MTICERCGGIGGFHADRCTNRPHPTPARWVTLPGDQQHTSSPDCPCQPVTHPSGAVDHR